MGWHVLERSLEVSQLSRTSPLLDEKECRRCQETKPIGEFPQRAGYRNGYSWCKPCLNEYQRVYKRNNPNGLDQVLARKYGMDEGAWERLLQAQGGLCAICKQPETAIRFSVVARLSVDHDHESGAVRGLLCDACNRGIGNFKDDPDRLEAAATYLARPRSVN